MAFYGFPEIRAHWLLFLLLLTYTTVCSAWWDPLVNFPCGENFTLSRLRPAIHFHFNSIYMFPGYRDGNVTCGVNVTSEPGTAIAVRVHDQNCKIYPCTCQNYVYVNITDSSGFNRYFCAKGSFNDDVFTQTNHANIAVAYTRTDAMPLLAFVFQFHRGECRSYESRCQNTGICVNTLLYHDVNNDFCNVKNHPTTTRYFDVTTGTNDNHNQRNSSDDVTVSAGVVLLFILITLCLFVTAFCCACFCCRRHNVNERNQIRIRVSGQANVPSVFSVTGANQAGPRPVTGGSILMPPDYDSLEHLEKPPSYEEVMGSSNCETSRF